MKEKQIFPISVLEQSADQIFNEKSHLCGTLYLIVLISLAGVLIAINFIHVDVNVCASGVIKPKEDHSFVIATTSGFIELRDFTLNSEVAKGDTLAIIRSELITSKIPPLKARQQELKILISDLRQLTSRDLVDVNLNSPIYKQDALYFLSQWNEAEAKRKQTQSAYERAQKLYDAKVIPLSEYEPIELEYMQAQNAIKRLRDYQQRQWQADLIGYRAELREIETQLEQISIQDAETIITAPTSGSILKAQSLFNGSFVTAGQQLIEISPNGILIAECYVPPKDVGFLHPGTTGRVQVSSFNYTEWGVLHAVIDEIFDDVSLSQDGSQSYYKVYCKLNEDYLTLKNGYKGYIKKGMAVNAMFLVTRRTVFQLLYDKVNDWLNPNALYIHE